jgi:hypothetical protein
VWKAEMEELENKINQEKMDSFDGLIPTKSCLSQQYHQQIQRKKN